MCKKICPAYVGLSCIDGSCPIANIDDYVERGYDVVRSCDDCSFYRGCDDCADYGCTPWLKAKYSK